MYSLPGEYCSRWASSGLVKKVTFWDLHRTRRVIYAPQSTYMSQQGPACRFLAIFFFRAQAPQAWRRGMRLQRGSAMTEAPSKISNEGRRPRTRMGVLRNGRRGLGSER